MRTYLPRRNCASTYLPSLATPLRVYADGYVERRKPVGYPLSRRTKTFSLLCGINVSDMVRWRLAGMSRMWVEISMAGWVERDVSWSCIESVNCTFDRLRFCLVWLGAPSLPWTINYAPLVAGGGRCYHCGLLLQARYAALDMEFGTYLYRVVTFTDQSTIIGGS